MRGTAPTDKAPRGPSQSLLPIREINPGDHVDTVYVRPVTDTKLFRVPALLQAWVLTKRRGRLQDLDAELERALSCCSAVQHFLQQATSGRSGSKRRKGSRTKQEGPFLTWGLRGGIGRTHRWLMNCVSEPGLGTNSFLPERLL